MREINTDPSDKTERPYTVDAGHFQIEMDVLNIPTTVTIPTGWMCVWKVCPARR
jgi:hypothetical protein